MWKDAAVTSEFSFLFSTMVLLLRWIVTTVSMGSHIYIDISEQNI